MDVVSITFCTTLKKTLHVTKQNKMNLKCLN